MKTQLIIEVETKDDYDVWEDCEKTEEDYTKKELKKYRKEYAKGLHKAVVERIQKYLKDDLEENFFDGIEEYTIEGWDDFEDYGIKIKVKEKKTSLNNTTFLRKKRWRKKR